MRKLEDKDYIQHYYVRCLEELMLGCPMELMYETLEYSEEQENYLACAGIKKALEFMENEVLVSRLELFNLDDIIKDERE